MEAPQGAVDKAPKDPKEINNRKPKGLLLSNQNKQKQTELIAKHFVGIFQALGLDPFSENLEGTPLRVARLYVDELFRGLDIANFPKLSFVRNESKSDQIVRVKRIRCYSVCEHHLLPFFGHADVAYCPREKILGLSKINRIIDFYCRRPQMQERLTEQISDELEKCLETPDIAVRIQAKHLCVAARGISDDGSTTETVLLKGRFKEGQKFYSSFTATV